MGIGVCRIPDACDCIDDRLTIIRGVTQPTLIPVLSHVLQRNRSVQRKTNDSGLAVWVTPPTDLPFDLGGSSSIRVASGLSPPALAQLYQEIAIAHYIFPFPCRDFV